MASSLLNKGHALLRHLEPPVRPSPAGSVVGLPVETLEASTFASLLERAQRGEIASGRVPTAAAIDEPLDPAAMPRIGRAMDLLEARGSQRAVILYGIRMFVATIATRTLDGELLAHEGPAPAFVDAAVRVPTPDEDRPTAFPGPPTAVTAPSDVIGLLEARDSHQ